MVIKLGRPTRFPDRMRKTRGHWLCTAPIVLRLLLTAEIQIVNFCRRRAISMPMPCNLVSLRSTHTDFWSSGVIGWSIALTGRGTADIALYVRLIFAVLDDICLS